MKKIFNIIALAALLLAMPALAQDARQRAVETIVQDALALMPTQNQTDFNREMEDLAKAAPQSVQMLCGMLQPAEKASNNLVEYALGGVVAYASANQKYKAAVGSALTASVSRAADATARQFIQHLIYILEGGVDVEYVTRDGAKTYTAQYEKLVALGENAAPEILKAVKSKDRAYRMQALKYATDHNMENDALVAGVVKLYKKGDASCKVDILNWLGDNKVKAQQPLMLKAVKEGGDVATAAIEALGKLGTPEAGDVLIAELGGANNDAAATALRSFKDNISGRVSEAMKTAQGEKLIALLSLAHDRRIRACGSQVMALCNNANKDVAEAALKALCGVVERKDAPAVAALLNNAPDANVSDLQQALSACLQRDEAKEQHTAISELAKKSSKPERYYRVMAATNTDESVAELQGIWEKDKSQAALQALKMSKNYNATKALWSAATQGDESALARYVKLVNDNVKDLDARHNRLAQALKTSKSVDNKTTILRNMANIPSLPAFTTVSEYVDDKELGYEASLAAKNIAGKAKDDIDYKQLTEVLGKASNKIKEHGSADDGYAVDEIKKMLAEAEPAPVYVLSEEEQKEGFELLFDGTNLDKWVGNKTGYVPVNGTIFVTANYGNEGNLYTVNEYKDFVFRFEFCFVRPGVNNGVGIRTPMGVDAAYEGMCESQILDHDDPIYAGLREYQVHGSVYGIIPAKRIKHKPLGEWSTEEIRVKGDHITVTVNGEVIVDGNVREACQGHNVAPDGSSTNPYTVDHRNHPGMFNKQGHIGFLGHGPGIKFRNIRVLDLTKTNQKKKK